MAISPNANFGPTPQSMPAGAITMPVGANYQAIVDAAPSGAVFWFEPGVHRLVAAITPKDNQSFLGAEGAVLSGAQTITSFTRSGSTWAIDGQTQEGLRIATGEGEDGFMRAGYPETVFINNTPLKPVDALSKVTPGTFFFDYGADRIYIGDDPAGRTVEVGRAAQAFRGDAQNVSISDLTIEKFNTPTQFSTVQGGEGWVIENNEIRLSYGVGASVESNGKIIGNYVHDMGEMGLDAGGENVLVEGNEIARNGHWSGIDVFWEGGGAKFTETTNLVVRGNYSHDNKGFGLWTDINNYNTLYEDNLVVNNSGGGITHEISYDAVIRNNTLAGNGFASQGDGTRGNPQWMWGGQIQNQNSQNVDIYGNTIDMTNSGNGIGLIQQDRGSGSRGAYEVTGNTIHDNIFISRDGNGRIGGAADFDEQGLLDGGNVWSNNAYYMADNAESFWWGDLDGFDDWRSATGETAQMSSPSAAPTLDWSSWTSTPRDTTTTPVPTPQPSQPSQPQPPSDVPDDADEPDVEGTAPVTTATVTGTSRNDTLNGGEGNDNVLGLGGNDRLFGSDGNDVLSGGAGRDLLWGGAGDDRISGDDGDDVLFGEEGNDVLTGGAGADRFEFEAGFGRDTITDFVPGRASADLIEFERGIFRDFADLQSRSTQKGADVVIAAPDGSELTLSNVSRSSLVASDFDLFA